MANSVIEVVGSTTSLTVSNSSVDVAVNKSLTQVVLGTSGPQGIQGVPGIDGSAAVLEHIADATPHPIYDDTPSLSLLFENGII